MEHVARKERHVDGEVEDAEAHDQDEAQDQRDPGRLERVPDALQRLRGHRRRATRARRALGADHEERRDHDQERQAVEQERGRHAEARDQERGDRGPDDARAVEGRGVERDGVAEVSPADHLGHERLARRHVDDVGAAEEQRQEPDVPVAHVPTPDERRERERLQAERRLGRNDQSPLGQPVGDRAPDHREHQDRRELERPDQSELERRAAQLEHEPGLGHGLHPRADQRDELAAPEHAEVAVVERAQRVGEGHRVVPACAAPAAKAR